MLQVGDMVQVTKTSDRYPAYRQWIELHCPQYIESFNNGTKADPNTETEYELICVAPHEWGNTICAILDSSSDMVFIMEPKSIKFIRAKSIISFNKDDYEKMMFE